MIYHKRYKSVVNIRKESTMSSVISQFQNTSCIKMPLTINLEQIVKLARLYKEIMRLVENQDYYTAFNKCTEWWDISAQPKLPNLEFVKNKNDSEKAKKLELLAIVSVQYLCHCFDLELKGARPDARIEIVQNQSKSLNLSIQVLSGSFQIYLLYMSQISKQLYKFHFSSDSVFF